MNSVQKVLQSRPSVPIDASLNDLVPTLAQLYAARGVRHADQLRLKLAHLLPANDLLGLPAALARLELALDQQQRILIVGDFDADGATSTALMVRALRQMGGVVDFLVPDRFKYGYGLTPEIVALALSDYTPELIVTVDNGISSHAGVQLAQQSGVDVIITDHHLTSKAPPQACAVVNPNQLGCAFASKALAGVGVAFYVLAALSSRRKNKGLAHSKLSDYLDLVALGTVADVAPLDANNRILVANGVARIQSRQCCAGILALLEVAGRQPEQLSAQDLGFVLGPRINAAGRMDNMRIGIECLLCDDAEQAHQLALQLDTLNRERRQVEASMKHEALALLTQREELNPETLPDCIVLYEPTWHQGVIGIVAGRLKEQFHRPSIVFAPSDATAQVLKGSARSIDGVHIRDAIERVAEQYPQLISHFGGHAAAAGLTLSAQHLPAFIAALNAVIAEYPPDLFQPLLLTDGELAPEQLNLAFAQQLAAGGPWGQAFPLPVFAGEFQVLEYRWLQNKHLKLNLRHPKGGAWLEALYFNADPSIDADRLRRVSIAYQLDINHFRGERRLQLMVQQLQVVD